MEGVVEPNAVCVPAQVQQVFPTQLQEVRAIEVGKQAAVLPKPV